MCEDKGNRDGLDQVRQLVLALGKGRCGLGQWFGGGGGLSGR